MSPLVVSPQLCHTPATSDLNVNPPLTRSGDVCTVASVVPIPSCPVLFVPQQYVSPDRATAQACVPPIAMAVAGKPTLPMAVIRAVRLVVDAARMLSPGFGPSVQM